MFRLEYEYIAKGFIFRKGRIKVTVSRVGITDILAYPNDV